MHFGLKGKYNDKMRTMCIFQFSLLILLRDCSQLAVYYMVSITGASVSLDGVYLDMPVAY
jgi:hypothetical protein